jgi:hypothetical protein
MMTCQSQKIITILFQLSIIKRYVHSLIPVDYFYGRG